MKIIVTMAGEGSRFKNIGFSIPKHEIIAKDKTLFEWSLLSLEDFFDEEFILIVRRDNYDEFFIEEKMKRLGIKDYSLVEINYLTDGQAESALLADRMITKDEEVVIYNIDTHVGIDGILKKDIKSEYSGFIPSFKAKGENWSFIKFNEELKISEVSEKVKISDYGTIGFYYFKSWEKYKEIYEKYKLKIKEKYKEVYIAPMYEYLIKEGENIYTSIVGSKKIHILGTPEDIEYFDYDYLEKQEDIEPYKRDLFSKMEFNKLDLLYEKIIIKNDIWVLEYIIYLCDTGRLDRVKKLLIEYPIEDMIKSKYYEYSEKKKITSIMFLRGNLSEFFFQTEYIGTLMKILKKKDNFLLQNYFSKNFENILKLKTPYLAMVINYIIEHISNNGLIKLNVLLLLIHDIADTNKYNDVRKKYLFKIIFSNLKKNFPEELIFPNKYNHYQKLTMILFSDYNKYSKGIKKINKEFNYYSKISCKNKEINEKKNFKKKTAKTAVCISGASRFDIEKQLILIKNNVVDPLEADVYIFSWDNVEVYPGLGSAGSLPHINWTVRYFRKEREHMPGEINTLGKFRKIFPKVSNIFETPVKLKNSYHKYIKIFPKAKILLDDEKSFEKKYKNKGYIRRDSLNQAKMFYGFYKSFNLIENWEDYDNIIKLRLDFPPHQKIKKEIINDIKRNEVYMYLEEAGPTDITFFGRSEEMKKILELWKIIKKNNDLSPFYVNGDKIISDSHRLLDMHIRNNNISYNTSKIIPSENSAEIILKNFKKELNEDLKNISQEEQKKYINFFELFFKYFSNE